MEEKLRMLHTEGVASHGGPESCVGVPRGRSEALTGGEVGRAIEPRNQRLRGADTVQEVEGNTAGGVRRESLVGPARSENHGVSASFHAREPGDPIIALPPVRVRAARGRLCRAPGMHGGGKSDSPVVPAKPPNKTCGLRRWWRKGGWVRGTRPGRHVPDAGPGRACHTAGVVWVKAGW